MANPPKKARTQKPPKFFYGRDEAAYSLAVSMDTIDGMIATQRLRTRKEGRRVLIPAEDVERVADQILNHDTLQKTA